MPELIAEFRSDAQIAAEFLAYWQSELSGDVAYAFAPMRLKGGADARLYRYQQVAEEKRVLRLLRPALDAQSRGAEITGDSARVWQPIGAGWCV